MYSITDKIILLYHHYGYTCSYGRHWLIFWSEPHQNYDLGTGVGGQFVDIMGGVR